MANVSRDWVVFEKGLVCGGLLGDWKHPGRVSSHVPDCWVAGGRVQPGRIFRGRGWEGIGRTHKNVKSGGEERRD